GNHHDAEDVAQACFMDLATHSDAINKPGSLTAWLHRIATRRALKLARGNTRRTRREQEVVTGRPEAAGPGWEEIAPALDTALEELPEELKVPLILYFFQELSQGEIAAQLDISRQTVARKLEKGIELLRERMAQAGGRVLAAGTLAGMLKV